MKRIITFMAAATLSISLNAQSITVAHVDPTLANDYAGGCEIDLNNDGLMEILSRGNLNGKLPQVVLLLMQMAMKFNPIFNHGFSNGMELLTPQKSLFNSVDFAHTFIVGVWS